MFRRLALPLAAATCLLPLSARAQDWALNGMDPVAYRAKGEAVPGQGNIVTLWHGMAWHFSSEENRASFEADPRAYAPALDGNCAVAMSEGRAEPGDPRFFVIIEHRTYLTGSAAARERLRRDPKQILRAAKATYESESR